MITQKELSEVQKLRKESERISKQIETLQNHAAIHDYNQRVRDAFNRIPRPAQLAEIESLQQECGAKSTAVTKLLDGFKTRIKGKDAEEIEAGKLALAINRTPVVAWEKLWMALGSLPKWAKACAAEPKIGELFGRVAKRDTSLEFVSERLAVDVVAAAPAGEAAK